MPFLDWVNKSQAVSAAGQVPYHLLQIHSRHGDDQSENLLVQGDNLIALKALLPFYRGQVKCIYIDPPYNTQSAFAHYDDKLEHSQWLSMMYPRLELLWELLDEDGSIWISIDDAEVHYLKVLLDEVFGRSKFMTAIAWQQRTTRENRKAFSANHEYLLVYARQPSQVRRIPQYPPADIEGQGAVQESRQRPAWAMAVRFRERASRPRDSKPVLYACRPQWGPPRVAEWALLALH